MTALDDHQFEVDGVVFGLDAPMHVTEDGFGPGAAAATLQRVKMASGDGQRFGKDTLGGATWQFKMFTNAEGESWGEAEQAAWAAVEDLAAVWPRDELRENSGAVTTLRYRIANRVRRIYGRPNRFTPTPNNFSLTGRIDVVADFDTVDHLIYDDVLQSESVSIGPPLDPEAGLLVPFVGPFVSNPGNAPRQGKITVGGREPTPIWVEIAGPVLNPRVQVGGKLIEIVDTVAGDDPVTVDARPWARSVTKRSGGGVKINARVTKVSQLYLPPGEHELIYTGTDNSGTSSVTVFWHNAFKTP